MRLLPSADECRHATRALARSPGFVATAVFSLGLSIALVVAMVGVIDALTHPKLPFHRQRELYRLGYSQIPPVRVDAEDAIRAAVARTGVIADTTNARSFAFGRVQLPSGEYTPLVLARSVEPNYFDVLGLRPFAGRFFTAADREEKTLIPAVVSYELWRRLYGDKAGFTPFTARLDTLSLTFVGVLPEYGRMHAGYDILVAGRSPATATRPFLAYSVVARAKPGTTAKELAAALDRVNADLVARGAMRPNESRLWFSALADNDVRVEGLSLALIGATFAILLVACANIANLQLARGLARVRELAVRSALGASRADVVRLLVTEAAIVAAASFAAGVLLSWCFIYVMRHLLPPEAQTMGIVDPQVSWRLLIAGLALTALCGVVFGLLPALRVSRIDLNDVLKSRMGVGDSRRTRNHYRALITCEIAGAMILCVMATLLARSTLRVRDFEFGFEADHLVFGSIGFRPVRPAAGRAGTVDSARWGELTSVIDAVRARPDVKAVGLMARERLHRDTISVEDPDAARGQFKMDRTPMYYVTWDLLRAMGIPVTNGSDFAVNDIGIEPAAIVDSLAIRRFWGGADPLGRYIKLGPRASSRPWIKVIGVVPHVRFTLERDMWREEIQPKVFVLDRAGPWRGAMLVVRTGPPATAVVSPIREILTRRPRVLLDEFGPFDVVSGRRAMVQIQTFIGSLFVAFAAFGLTLAMVGVYGVISHSVAQRRREFGVRIALGARASHVLRLVLDDGNAPILIGIAVGLIGANWGYGLITRYLIGEEGFEALATFGFGVVGMVVAALAAMVEPAVRAVRVNPVEALRGDW
jgi:putative ABC transport system permease protein